MTESAEPETPRPPRRRPSVADVFGDVLPDVTSDERSPDRTDRDDDTWYEDNRPPHHDRG
ncbi:MAG TPA: hypothetical protein VHF06_12110 [Pseudonocardiaceae bacterium]|nr:hypothetical protein [Pseudonocardiaceae bacterium]